MFYQNSSTLSDQIFYRVFFRIFKAAAVLFPDVVSMIDSYCESKFEVFIVF